MRSWPIVLALLAVLAAAAFRSAMAAPPSTPLPHDPATALFTFAILAFRTPRR